MCYQLWVSSFEMLKSILLYISYMLLLRGKRIIAKKLEAIETKCKTIGWEMRNMMDYDGIWYVSKQLYLDRLGSGSISMIQRFSLMSCVACVSCVGSLGSLGRRLWRAADGSAASGDVPSGDAGAGADGAVGADGATGTSAASALGSVGSSSCSLWASQISTTWMLKNVEKFNLQNEAFTKTFSLKIGKKCCRERK